MNKTERLIPLFVVGFLGLWGTFGLWAITHLIEAKTDANALAVLVALVGPVIGSMSTILTNLFRHPSPTGTPSDPVSIQGGDTENAKPVSVQRAETIDPALAAEKDNPNE